MHNASHWPNGRNFRFQLRRGSAAEWTAGNPVLLSGEPAVELDTYKFKIGNGVTAWNDLAYFPDVDDIIAGVASVDGRTGVVTLVDLYAALVHTHAQSDITGLTADLAAKADDSHVHAASDVTSGVFGIARLPTGTTSSTVSLGNHTHAGPTITVSSTAPSSPATGDVWIDTSS